MYDCDMKKILLILSGALLLVGVVSPVYAQKYFECVVTSSSQDACEPYKDTRFECQLYNPDDFAGECTSICYKASGIPSACAQQEIRKSRHPVTRTDWTGISDDSVITYDDDEAYNFNSSTGNNNNNVSPEEVQYIIESIVGMFRDDLFSNIKKQISGIGDAIGDAKDSIISSIPFVGDNDKEEIEKGGSNKSVDGTDIDRDEVIDSGQDDDEFDTDPYGGSGFNEFKTRDWIDGVKVGRMIDPYGKEQFTSDGEHFYDTEYAAVHSGEGISNIVNVVGDNTSAFFDFLFKGKSKDADTQLQNNIAREVLKDSQSQSEKDVEKAHEKISGKIKTPTGGDVPAKVIIMVAQESKEADFAQGVRSYISERKKGNDMSYIRQNFSQELSGGYGTFSAGVSQSTVAKQAEGVLYSRYEESYQRYLLAKEFGRTE
ncbi:hypothetical protein COB18_02535 [Candidatus Kaiserbacteria bacterium]|nr:MAG: hypothetical protein COB18_02535 [Candidatus Kaiserbacteria bacterium]